MSVKIQELEIKVAFLEDALNKLSDEHYQQQKSLDKLQKQYALLCERLSNSDDGASSEMFIEDERPPHY